MGSLPSTPWFLDAAAPGSSRSPCPLGWTSCLWTSRCRPRIPMSPVCGSHGATGAKEQHPSRPRDPTRCCSSGSVQLTSVHARVPRVLGGGLLSHLVPPSTADLKPRRAGLGQPPGSLRSPKPRKTPRATWQTVLSVRRQLSPPTAINMYRLYTHFVGLVYLTLSVASHG